MFGVKRTRNYRCNDLNPKRSSEMNAMLDANSLEEHTRTLYAYALKKVRNATLAEDLVQETFLAALGAAGKRFAGRSSVRTWLIGILKHKIADAFRERAKAPISYAEGMDHSDTPFEADTDAGAAPFELAGTELDPEAAMARKRFVETCQRHLDGLPPKAARAFVLTDVLGHDTKEVCAMLGMTDANLWTTLHRTRRSLRGALEVSRPI
jgi:RNA polymerase sigma-70 factor (ECF subfamily)